MSRKPNILFILSDDLGQWALGAYDNQEVISPTIDQLAREGARFDNFFCTSPVCSPARASLLTGKMPSQHGVHDWIGGGSVSREMINEAKVNLKSYLKRSSKEEREELLKDRALEDISDTETIKFSETYVAKKFRKHEDKPIQYLEGLNTYTEVLADNGYECGLVGKWHLGASAHKQCGISYWKTIAGGGTPYMFGEFIVEDKIEFKTDYSTDIITNDAIEFLELNKENDQPFYLSVNYTAPHDPWVKEDQPEEIWNLYNNCPFDSVPFEEIHPNQNPYTPYKGDTKERRDYLLQAYYTTITGMDRGIKQLLDKLDEIGERENTIIIFSSDNGMNMGHHGIWGKGNGTIPQNMFDTSVKVPFIMNYPRLIPKNTVCTNLLSQYDFMPTILDLVGIDHHLNTTFPGKSFLPLLEGNQLNEKESVVIYDEYGPTRMVRTKEYKYVHRYPLGPHEFYYLKDDPEEKTNLIDHEEYNHIIIQLRNTLEEWFVNYVNPCMNGAVLPVTGRGQHRKANRGQHERYTFT